MLKTFRRHLANCPHRSKGRRYLRCSCPIWVDGTLDGHRVLKSLDTANLEIAANKVLHMEADQKVEDQVSVNNAVDDFLKANKELASIYTYNQVLIPLKRFCLNRGISAIRAITYGIPSVS